MVEQNQTISTEDKNKLKSYSGTLSLEQSLRDPKINQDPSILKNVVMGLGDKVLDDPEMAMRMPTPELAFQTERYLGYNWENQNEDPNYNGFNINDIVTTNHESISNEYASLINKKLEEISKKVKKDIETKGKTWKGLSKETVAHQVGNSIMRTLEPEQLRQISESSESDKRNMVYGQRAKSRPYLTGNVAFYENPSEAENLMIRLVGEQFIKETSSEEDTVKSYELDVEKLRKHYDIMPQKKDANGNDILDEEKAKANREKYASMALTL